MQHPNSIVLAGLFLAGAPGLQRATAQVPLFAARVASGFTKPVCITHAPGDATRLFVAEKGGKIRILAGGSVLATPFLDLSGIVNATTLEWGLLSLCFDPQYATNGFLYVNYTAGPTGDTTIARFQVSSDPNVADPSSNTKILSLAQSNQHHRGGWLGFGAEGYLYASLGDGGPQEDPLGNAQNPAVLHGKILRLDVRGDDFPADPDQNYRVPPTNPFVGVAGHAPEIWALGLRNPWRCSFDRSTGDLWIGDVGEYLREEVDFQPAGIGGQNYGWRCTEGTTCSGFGGCTCNDASMTPPIHDYVHQTGRSVTCGYVYRGAAIPGLQGTFLFGDYQLGKFWSFAWNGVSLVQFAERTAEFNTGAPFSIEHPSSFGEDAQGELFVCDYLDGDVFQIVASPLVSFCAGDGSATPCPCGNVGAPGSGCASSFEPNGARLTATGAPRVAADTLVLQASGLSNATCTFFQGTTAQNGGSGTIFGDGLRCAGGAVIRLGAVAAALGTAQYPNPGAPSVSVRGAVTNAGTSRTYQVWYRNAASFCNPETFNLTNGLSVEWQ